MMIDGIVKGGMSTIAEWIIEGDKVINF